MHQDNIRFHFQSVLFCGSAMGRDNSRALEEKVWQYPFVEHLSFLLYFTFKISAGEPFSFYPFVQHVSSILHFAARGETEH